MKHQRPFLCCKNIWGCLFFQPCWQVFLTLAFRVFTLSHPAALIGSLCFSLLQSQQSSLSHFPSPLPQKDSPFGSHLALRSSRRECKRVCGHKRQRSLIQHQLDVEERDSDFKGRRVWARVLTGKCSSHINCDSSWAAALHRCYIL